MLKYLSPIKLKMNDNEIILFNGKARYLKNIKLLQFDPNFNELLDKYISHPIFTEIEQILFGYHFNQSPFPIIKCTKLQHIIFGNDFNQPTDNLPTSLKSITYGFSFNQPIEHLPSIKVLKLGFFFQQSLDFLPASLIHLELLFHYPYPFEHIGDSPYKWFNRNLTLDHLPSGLETLIVTRLKGVKLLSLPKSIKKLVTEEIPIEYYASY